MAEQFQDESSGFAGVGRALGALTFVVAGVYLLVFNMVYSGYLSLTPEVVTARLLLESPLRWVVPFLCFAAAGYGIAALRYRPHTRR
ncbi:hypothetical protein ACFQH6_09000 [Halobacteriaceae archaeon GCM10025711]